MGKGHRNYINITIQPYHITLPLLGFVAILAVGHVIAHGITSFWDIHPHQTYGLFRFFTMADETSLSTFVSALNLIFAGILLIFIACNKYLQGNRYTPYWWCLAIGLLVMGVDEAAMIHDGIIGKILAELVGRGEGFFYYIWTAFYIPVVLIIAILYIPFLKHLPPRYRTGLILAGAIYICGAIGFEMVESYLRVNNLSKGLSILFEETFEMLGIVTLIHILLSYIADQSYALQAQVVSKKASHKYRGSFFEKG